MRALCLCPFPLTRAVSLTRSLSHVLSLSRSRVLCLRILIWREGSRRIMRFYRRGRATCYFVTDSLLSTTLYTDRWPRKTQSCARRSYECGKRVHRSTYTPVQRDQLTHLLQRTCQQGNSCTRTPPMQREMDRYRQKPHEDFHTLRIYMYMCKNNEDVPSMLYLPATQSAHSEAPNHRDRTPISAPAISRRSPAWRAGC